MSKQIASPSPVPPNFLLIPLSACENGLNMIFNWLDEYKEELLKDWELSQKGEPLIKISPLI